MGTLTVAFLDLFSPKFLTDVRTRKSKNEFVYGEHRNTRV